MHKCPACDCALKPRESNEVYAFKNRNVLSCPSCSAVYRFKKPVTNFVVYLHFTIMTLALLGLVQSMLGVRDNSSVYFGVILAASVIIYFKYANPAPKDEVLEKIE